MLCDLSELLLFNSLLSTITDTAFCDIKKATAPCIDYCFILNFLCKRFHLLFPLLLVELALIILDFLSIYTMETPITFFH